MRRITLFFLLSSFLFACVPAQPTDASQTVTIYATPAAQPWLDKLYACADSASVILNVEPGAPDILLRVGPPEGLSTPSFQIDTEDILIVVNRTSPLQNLTIEQARVLFAGQGDPSFRVWVYPAGEDVQAVFDQAVMDGRRVVSSARVAVTPQQMSDTLNADVTAVGILPRHWKMGTVRDVFTLPAVPVLAITPSEPQGLVRDLIACLQK